MNELTLEEYCKQTSFLGVSLGWVFCFVLSVWLGACGGR